MSTNTNESSSSKLMSRGTYVDRIGWLLESGADSDVILTVGQSKEEIKAHKVILKAASPVFEKVFTVWSSKDRLKVPLIEPKVFRQLLKFMYRGEWSENPKDAFPLLEAGRDYELPDLVDKCRNVLKENLNSKTALYIFTEAIEVKDDILEQCAIQVICRKAFEIVDSENFLKLGISHLENLVKLDDLGVRDEVQLFRALIRWAEFECRLQDLPVSSENSRKVIDILIPHIRFPQMDPGDFSIDVCSKNILTTAEIVSVLAYYNVPVAKRSLWHHAFFNASPRRYTGDLPTYNDDPELEPQSINWSSDSDLLNETNSGFVFPGESKSDKSDAYTYENTPRHAKPYYTEMETIQLDELEELMSIKADSESIFSSTFYSAVNVRPKFDSSKVDLDHILAGDCIPLRQFPASTDGNCGHFRPGFRPLNVASDNMPASTGPLMPLNTYQVNSGQCLTSSSTVEPKDHLTLQKLKKSKSNAEWNAKRRLLRIHLKENDPEGYEKMREKERINKMNYRARINPTKRTYKKRVILQACSNGETPVEI